MTETKYHLACVEGGEVVTDHYTSACPAGHNSLLRTVYAQKQLQKRAEAGMFTYLDWLPVTKAVPTDACPRTYRSEALGKELGLTKLYISFSGYWPERDAFMKTCTFKELEALPTLQRAKELVSGKTLVIASAGNTARAFAEVAAMTGQPVVAVVPRSARHRLWTTSANQESVFLITVDGDYSDAIASGKRLAALNGLLEEGGVRNVARRDGMGVVELEAASTMKRLPDYYFQAVGSGAGAIAAWEAFSRLMADGRFGARMPRLILSQNLPFAPMVRAWREGRAEIIPERDMRDAEAAIQQMYADVLSTRNPPYSLRGGVYELLRSTKGEMYGITNEECRAAEKLFVHEEGIDLDPAASVTVASVLKALDDGLVEKNATVLLNVTGGGYKRLPADWTLHRINERMELSRAPSESELDEVEGEVKEFVRALRS
jgi:cysteate synthase